MPLTVGLDVRAAVRDPYRGLGRVARSLLHALARCGDLHLVAFRPPDAASLPLPPGIEAATLPAPRRGAFLLDGVAWRIALARRPVDVLHLPAWGVPPGLPVPVVATLHDVTPIRYPESIPGRWTRRRAVRGLRSLHRATLVHAVSRATARDAVRVLGLPPRRVRTVPNGTDPPPGKAGGRREHVLYVGGADPHKRVAMLAALWSGPEAAGLPPLVVAGAAAHSPAVTAAAERAPGRVVPAGTVDDDRLEQLYAGALAVLLPSLWEGFGLPALEGMRHGAIPVLTARAALPEAGGDAALYVPATAPPAAWTDAVSRLVTDPGLAARLRRAALRRAATSGWDRTADGLARVYREAATRSSI